MNDPEQPDTELERRYRRLLRLFPAHYRRDWGQELLAVLMQNAKPGQRRPEPAEAAALLWQAGKVWCHTAVSADRNANHRAAAILTVALPLLLLFPAAKAVAEFMLSPSSSMWRQHFDLITWALWIPAAAASVVGPRNVARWIAGLAVLAYLVFLLRPVLNGGTGTISTSFGWLLIQVTACRLLTSGRRVALGRRLLWRGRKALAGSAVLIFVVLAAPVLLEATPGLTRPFFAAMTLAVIAAAEQRTDSAEVELKFQVDLVRHDGRRRVVHCAGPRAGRCPSAASDRSSVRRLLGGTARSRRGPSDRNPCHPSAGRMRCAG